MAANDESEGSAFFTQLVEAIFPLSYLPAQTLAEALDVAHTTETILVLDLAAGSGVWGIALAEKSPHVYVTAVDWEGVIPTTKQVAKRFGVANRFRYIAGDLMEAEFDNGYHIATLGHILHSEGEQHSRALLRKTFRALAPGGTIAIAEWLVNEDRMGPPHSLIFAVNMLVNTERRRHLLVRRNQRVAQRGRLREPAPVGSARSVALNSGHQAKLGLDPPIGPRRRINSKLSFEMPRVRVSYVRSKLEEPYSKDGPKPFPPETPLTCEATSEIPPFGMIGRGGKSPPPANPRSSESEVFMALTTCWRKIVSIKLPCPGQIRNRTQRNSQRLPWRRRTLPMTGSLKMIVPNCCRMPLAMLATVATAFARSMPAGSWTSAYASAPPCGNRLTLAMVRLGINTIWLKTLTTLVNRSPISGPVR